MKNYALYVGKDYELDDHLADMLDRQVRPKKVKKGGLNDNQPVIKVELSESEMLCIVLGKLAQKGR